MLQRVWMPSPNYSSRAGAGVRLVVVHTAEGALTYQSLGNYFASPSSGVSSHVGIDDTPGVVGEYVARDHKAWTQGNANPYSTAAELCAFAAWTPADWAAHPVMVDNCAAWIAEECAAFGIPNRKLSAAEAQGGAAGVCGHADLGAAGGGHWDPGPSFPWDRVLGGATPTPPSQGDANMVLQDPVTGGYWVAEPVKGAVYAYDGAPWLGATNNLAMNANNFPCVGIGAYGDGYTIVLDFGEAGDADGDRHRRFRFPRDGSGAA
jgi:hypothetical protein